MPCATVTIQPDENSGDNNGDVSLQDNPVEWAKENPVKAGAGAIVAMNFLGN